MDTVSLLVAAGIVSLIAIAIMVLAIVRSRRPLRTAMMLLPGLLIVCACVVFLVYTAVRPLFRL